MKYSLRSLMVVVTLACAVCGYATRAIPLLQVAKEYDEWSQRMDALSDNCWVGKAAKEGAVIGRMKAAAFRRAAWMPWLPVPSKDYLADSNPISNRRTTP